MVLDVCPACTHRISQQARFCVHCRASIPRATGLDIKFERCHWRRLQSLITKFRDSQRFRRIGRARENRTPSARLCLFLLMAATLLLTMEQVFFVPSTIAGVIGLARALFVAILVYTIFMIPAWLAFGLMLARRPVGLYGALAVFLFSFLATVVVLTVTSTHEPLHRLLLGALIGFVSGCGVIVAFREAAGGSILARILAFGAFLVLQLGTVVGFFVLTIS